MCVFRGTRPDLKKDEKGKMAEQRLGNQSAESPSPSPTDLSLSQPGYPASLLGQEGPQEHICELVRKTGET